jgi:hypothetical protein
MTKLLQIQAELKSPKNQFNSFGKYNYRSCEDILEAVKPLLLKHGCTLTIMDDVKQVGAYTFIEASVVLFDGETQYLVTAQAGIEQGKGMSLSQSFGASSSYARKYALNGLFLIDDTKDADVTNKHGKDEKEVAPEDLKHLKSLVYKGKFDSDQTRSKAFEMIDNCKDYDTFLKILHRLEELQPGIDEIPNPSQGDIKKHIKKVVNG